MIDDNEKSASSIDNPADGGSDPADDSLSTIHSQLSTKRKRPGGVISATDLSSMHFERLQLPGRWAKLMQNPAKNMKLAIWGKPKQGKSSMATQLARVLADSMPVLYNFADQGINASTQEIIDLAALDDHPNFDMTDTRDLAELDGYISAGDYGAVFIDLINTYIARTKITPAQFDDQFLKKYPDKIFALVFETTKEGNFKGDQAWTHLVDGLITVEDHIASATGRYGMGTYDVWPLKPRT